MSANWRIGVLAETVQQLGELTRIVRGAGFNVAASVEAVKELGELPDVDVWVVNLDLHQVGNLAIIEALDANNKHVIFDNDLQAPVPAKGEGEPPLLPAEIRIKRERRLAQKLRQWVEPQATTSSQKRAKQVWVLAASTGGPEAVNAFLKAIPAQLRDVAFIYAQHIEFSGLGHLLKAVQANTGWQVHNVTRAHTLAEQSVYVVSPQTQIELLDGGTIAPSHNAWSGKYRPSLNQVIAKVARIYGNRGGAIVFSGMGDDGADSCTMLRHRGGQVWVQTPETCAVDSMPQSVLAKGCVHVQAAPKELAERFVKFQKYGQTS